MEKIIFFIFSMFVTSEAFSGYADNLDLNRVYVNSGGLAILGTLVQPPGTCSFYGDYFQFDTKTEAGKSMLSMLLSAKMIKKKVIIWYNESTAPGTDQTSGCTGTTNAVVTAIGVRE